MPPTGGPSGTRTLPDVEAKHTTPPSRSTTSRACDVESEDETELTGAEASSFRSMAAILNYLSIDRPDVKYAVTETARMMSKPTVCDWRPLKHISQDIRFDDRD